MQPALRHVLDELLAGQEPVVTSMEAAVGALMDGECSEAEIASLLTALAVRGETVDELVGAARAMRSRATRIPTTRTGLLDTCGTGGDKLHTFNISTATAIVAAAAGLPVAKHGNRSVSSSSGSADVLEALGVNLDLTAEQAGRCLDDIGICFCYARLLHTAMKHVAPVRGQLGFRTIFNLLGPLTNPAGAEYQLIGVGQLPAARKVAHALAQLQPRRAFVVCGNNQLDEVATWGETVVYDITGSEVREATWTPADLQLAEGDPADLRVNSPQESADVIRRLFAGEPGPGRDIVLANTAAALMVCGQVKTPHEGVERAAATIDDGQAARLLASLADWTCSAR